MTDDDIQEPDQGDDLLGIIDTGARAVLLMPTMYNYEPHCFASVFEAARKFGMRKLRFADPIVKTCIWKARDRMAHIFLNDYDAEYALWIDSDMGIPSGNPGRWRRRFNTTLPARYGEINAIERILSHPPSCGIVGGVYFDRRVGAEIMCKDGCGKRRNTIFIERVKTGVIRGLVKQPWVGHGFKRVHRRVYEKMAANVNKFPEIKPAGTSGRYGFHMPYIQGGHSEIGEDVAFDLRAKEVGEQVWLDTDIRLFHCGSIWR